MRIVFVDYVIVTFIKSVEVDGSSCFYSKNEPAFSVINLTKKH